MKIIPLLFVLLLFSCNASNTLKTDDYEQKVQVFGDWDKAFIAVITHEGGYINDPFDKGGETKYGISQRSYPDIDIKNMTLIQAKHIYFDDYYLKSYANTMPFYTLKLELFDTAVNMGVVTAIKILQEALNLTNQNGALYKDLIVDGIIGENTFNAINIMSKTKNRRDILLKTLNGLQFMHYVKITNSSVDQEQFFHGWINKRIDF